MTIRQISLNDFRNLKSTTLDLHPKLNLISGSNASGKTSFLEAVYILCQAQSFRTHQLTQCVQHKSSSFLLFSYFDSYKAGITRTALKTKIRINGETIHKVSTLAEKSPVRVINSETFKLILGSPSDKREFIDWCLFHVEQNYHRLWLDYNHALKQRNALLKQRTNLSQLTYWDTYLDSLNTSIYDLRVAYLERFKELFNQEFNDFVEELDIDIIYKPGWDQDLTLLEILTKQRQTDIKYGYTRYGIHRDDISITSSELLSQNILSRGQVKKLSILLVINQILLIKKLTDKNIILLIDDLESELDQDSINYLLEKLAKESIQLFISTINYPDYLSSYYEDYKMFHVEHGIIKPVKHI